MPHPAESPVDFAAFLTQPFNVSNEKKGWWERYFLVNHQGKRAIWVRVYFDGQDSPTRSIIGLETRGWPLAQATVTYTSDRMVTLTELMLGVGHDGEKPMYVAGYVLQPHVLYHVRTPGRGLWYQAGSTGPMGVVPKRYSAFAQEFYPPETLHMNVDLAETAGKFLEQLQGYLRDPRGFEPDVSPRITPTLITI